MMARPTTVASPLGRSPTTQMLTSTSTSNEMPFDDIYWTSTESLSLQAACTPKKMKHLAPQDAIDEFWTKFNTKNPGKATTILPSDIYAQKVGEKAPKGIVRGQNAVASYEEAVRLCKLKVDKIAKECRRINQKYRDPYFDIEFDLKWRRKDCLETLPIPNRQKSVFKPQAVKRVGDIFDAPSFYISGATPNDVRQGRDGDCWLLAAICTLGNKPGLIEKVCVARDEAVGVYGFVFFRDSEWRSEIIDDKLYLTKPDYDESILERVLWEDRERISSEEDYRKAYQTNSGALYFAQCEDPNETWLPLLEKAYAKAHGDYAAIEGGFTGEGIEDLTGGVTTELFTTDILDKEDFWKNELMKVNEDFLFGCATGLFQVGWRERKGIRENHAYSIMKAVEVDNHRLVLLRNPWGKGEWTGPWSDGSSQWTPEWMQKLNHRFGNDGAFWMSYDDLLRKYQTFDRTRLFNEDWKVTQQWAHFQIPWTVTYHDTKFAFTLSKATSVVVVLTQLDPRYFRGLEGQYSFELSFRLHKANDDDYIVRSHGNYCMRRSVSVELDLEAGEYHVLIKILAERDAKSLPVEQVIRENSRERRDKLLRIGLAYDLAHAKGQYIETEEEKQSRENAEARIKAKERKEVRDRLMKVKKQKRMDEMRKGKREKARKLKKEAKAKARSDRKKEVKVSEERRAENTILEQLPTVPEESSKPPPDVPSGKTPPSADEQKISTTLDEQRELMKFEERKESTSTIDTLASSVPPDDCRECNPVPKPGSPRLIIQTQNLLTADKSIDHDDSSDDTDTSISSISSTIIDAEIAKSSASSPTASTARTPTLPPATPAPSADGVTSATATTAAEEEDEFERDPWNAVAVVGLRVYSFNAEATIRVVRPRTWEDGETSLDVDDSAVDATKDVDEDGDGDHGRKSSVMGFRGRLGSVVAGSPA